MTDKETTRRESEWVKARFNCTAEKVLEQLVTVNVSDIRAFSRMAGSDACEMNRIDGLNCIFKRRERVAMLAMHGNMFKSIAYCGSAELSDSRVEITPKWNDGELCCDLMMYGKKVSIHRARQKIVGNVLFGSWERIA